MFDREPEDDNNAFSDLELKSQHDDITQLTPGTKKGAASRSSGKLNKKRNAKGNKSNTSQYDSNASLFQSEVTLHGDSPFKQQLLENVNKNEGTLTSINYQSNHGQSHSSLVPTMSLRRNQHSRSRSSMRSRKSRKSKKSTKSRSGRSPNNSFKSTLGRNNESFNEEKFKLIEQRIISNTRGRNLVEETDIMIDSEIIKRKIFQPRRNEHGDFLQTTSVNACVLIAKGEVFDEPEGNKPCQDCVAVATWQELDCFVICDGHGKSGEEVAWQVSNYISGTMMKNMVDHFKTHRKEDLSDAKVFDAATSPEIIKKIFHECDEKVIWTKELRNFTWAKIIGGEHEGLLCQISSPDLPMGDLIKVLETSQEKGVEGEEDIPVSIFLNGEREFRSRAARLQIFGQGWTPPDRQLELGIEQKLIKRKHLLCERDFFGGSTCVMLIRNNMTNQFRFATSGDSRILYVPAEETKPTFPNDETAIKISPKPFGLRRELCSCWPGNSKRPSYKGKCVLSVEHNVHDSREMQRLQRDFAGCYIVGDGVTNEGVEGYLYSNALFPYTGGITPTRGFGDRLYFGSGYTCEPEVSEVHLLLPGSMLIGGSDGVFDDSIWGKNMQGLAYVIKMMQSRKMRTEEIVSEVHRQTVRRCKEWHHFRVDDISLFGFQSNAALDQSL